METLRHIRWRAMCALLWLTLTPSVTGATDVSDVLTRMHEALTSGTDMRASMLFVMTNEHGESVRWTGEFQRTPGGALVRFIFHSPLDIRGIEVTARHIRRGIDETEIYLPSLRRNRKIEADMRGESFLGTDFNYEDLGLEELDFHQHSLRDKEKINGRNCYRVESVPDDSWWYGKIVRFIDTKSYLPRLTEYYAPGGGLFKVRTLDRVARIEKHDVPTVITMRTVPLGTSTRIEFSDVRFNMGVPASEAPGHH